MSGEAEVSTAGEQLTRISLTGGNDKAIDQKTTAFKKNYFYPKYLKKPKIGREILFWKKETTLSLNDSFPSARAKPTAVAVKLLLKEYKECLKSDRYGFHQPSAITLPWRSNIKL